MSTEAIAVLWREDDAYLPNKRFKQPNLPSDHIQAGAPEIDAVDISAEALAEGDGVSEAGGA